MIFVGIDLHKKNFVAYAEDNEGEKVFSDKFECSLQAIEKLLSNFKEPPKVVVEATRNWMWFVRGLKEKGCEVVMAHPFRTKAIASAKIKTDSIDAKTLCQLLRAGLIPASYIASTKEVDDREISRARISLVKQKTKAKNLIISLLAKENLSYKGSDLFGVTGRRWLSEQSLSSAKRLVVDSYLATISNLMSEITKIDKVIKEKCSESPQAKLLNTIPGIGPITAFLLASEIGSIDRFNSAKSFASYFGLVPRLSQSGDHAYYGRITKLGNPYVRWSLVQLAHRIVKTSESWRLYRDRLSYRSGKKKATVAVARKLSTAIFAILRDNKEYNPKLIEPNKEKVR